MLGIGDLFKYWLKKAPILLQPRKGEIPSLELPGKKAWIERLPRGVIGVISPWNFPVSLPMRSLVPALLAGNGVLLKPSEITPLTGEWLVARLRESLGDIVDVMPGAGVAGAALVESLPDMVVLPDRREPAAESPSLAPNAAFPAKSNWAAKIAQLC